MRQFGYFVFACLLTLGTTAQAKVITVKKSGGADATTFVDALHLLENGDTIRILDSEVYSENIPSPINRDASGGIISSMTIEAADGQTPVIERSEGDAPTIRIGGAQSGTITIRGASNDKRMIIRNLGTNQSMIHSGQMGSTHNLIVENVTLEKPTSGLGGGGLFYEGYQNGANTLTNVDLKGGDGEVVTAVIHVGSKDTTTFNNVDLRCNASAIGTLIGNIQLGADDAATEKAGDIIFNNCFISISDESSAVHGKELYRDSNHASISNTITFNDCTFRNAQPGIEGIRSFHTVRPVTIIINRPTFLAGHYGDLFYNGTDNQQTSQNGATFILAGTPEKKADINAFIGINSTVIPLRTSFGTIVLRDVTASTPSPNGTLIDCGDTPYGEMQITLERCHFSNGTSEIRPWVGGDTSVNKGKYGVTVTLINCIWQGGMQANGTLQDQFFWSQPHDFAPRSTIFKFYNCTFQGPTANIFVNTSNPSDLGRVAVFSYNTIWDYSQAPTQAANGEHPLNGYGNLSWKGDNPTVYATAWPVGMPADTIIGKDPKLDANGMISAEDSAALNGAIDCELTDAYDGSVRPQGPMSDIGADEKPWGTFDFDAHRQPGWYVQALHVAQPPNIDGVINESEYGINGVAAPLELKLSTLKSNDAIQPLYYHQGTSKSVYGVYKTTKTPIIDGTYDATEWPASCIIERLDSSKVRRDTNLSPLSKDNPVESVVYAQWDDQYLYLLSDVTDNSISVSTSEAVNIYDDFEVCVLELEKPYRILWQYCMDHTGRVLSAGMLAPSPEHLNIKGTVANGHRIYEARIDMIALLGGDYEWGLGTPELYGLRVLNANRDAGASGYSLLDANDHRMTLLDAPTKSVPSFTDDSDLSAKIYFAWDDTALYVAADVKDNQVQRSANITDGDAFQLFLDFDQTASNNYLGGYAGKIFAPVFAIVAGSGTVTGSANNSFEQLWPIETDGFYPNPMIGTQWNIKTVTGGYQLEASIPWTAMISEGSAASFANPMPPMVGQQMNCMPVIHDNDGQGHKFMASSGNDAYTLMDASTYTKVRFLDKAKSPSGSNESTRWTAFE